MRKEDLESKARKAILAIKNKVIDIDNLLRDIDMKLCHIIRYKQNFTKYDAIDYLDCYRGYKR